ncbi:hypothetical protein BGZ46_001109 [Entomortierella lignicola]|nr:hypothetical protein BGZ46_001109 [Entomortierella lignicola]
MKPQNQSLAHPGGDQPSNGSKSDSKPRGFRSAMSRTLDKGLGALGFSDKKKSKPQSESEIGASGVSLVTMPVQGFQTAIPGQGYQTMMPGQGFQMMPGQGFQMMPGQGSQMMPGQGFQTTVPGQGFQTTVPGQGFQTMPGQGFQIMPGQGYQMMSGQGYQMMPGQGFQTTVPGQGFQMMPGQGFQMMPGQGFQMMPVQGYQMMPGQAFPASSMPGTTINGVNPSLTRPTSVPSTLHPNGNGLASTLAINFANTTATTKTTNASIPPPIPQHPPPIPQHPPKEAVNSFYVPNGNISAPSSSQSSTPIQTSLTAIDSDIFTEYNAKKDGDFVTMPAVGEVMDHTVQLVQGIRLLAESSESSTTTLLTSNSSLSEWVQAIKEHPAEIEYLHHLANKMVERFIALPYKGPDNIREIVLLGLILDKDTHRKLLNSFLGEFEKSSLVDLDLLLGMIQLVQDAPPKSLRSDSLIQIIRAIRRRLEDPAQKKGEYLANLVLSATRILIIMVACEVKELDRVQEHEPLMKLLVSLKDSTDPLVRFQAKYACQVFRSIPDDETGFQEFRRHVVDFTGGLFQMSHLIKMELDGVVDGLPGVIKGGRGLLGMMKKALATEGGSPWYQSVLQAEKLAQQGKLADLNKLICEGPCRRAPLFQWGVCQLLGEIAVDQSWNSDTRSQAVKLLGQMFKFNIGPEGNVEIRKWVLTVLNHILNCQPSFASTTPPLYIQVRDLIRELGRGQDQSFFYVHPLRSQLPSPKASSLLKDVNDKPDIELLLQRLRLRRRNDFDSEAVFVPQLSKLNLQAKEDKLTPLKQRVDTFLAGNRQVFLILGDSGAGKSTFIRKLEYDLWDQYKPGNTIPLFIDLKTVNKTGNDMIERHLADLHLFSESQIMELRRTRVFYLLCDGYDEWHKWSNIHSVNRFNQPNQWRTKMIITCRTQYLVSTYRGYFEPQSPNPNVNLDLYEEAVVVSFKMEQIKDYVDQYTAASLAREPINDQPVWTSQQYMDRLKEIVNLMDLIKNPFMLRMVMETLPKIKRRVAKITRAELYDEFTELHFETELRRLVGQNARNAMAPDCATYFSEIQGEDFVHLGVEFSKDLAYAMFKEQDGQNSVQYSSVMDEGTWKTKFFGTSVKARLFRESIQVVCRSNADGSAKSHKENILARKRNAYEFTHRSLLEYFYSRLVFDPAWNPREFDLTACLGAVDNPKSLGSHPLAQMNLVPEASVIQFLVERAQQIPRFESLLRAIVERSKRNTSIGYAAANAMTILIRAGVDFNGADLKSIRIPGADLTGGHFDSADFNGTDLIGVNFTRAWLRQADFSRAQMDKVQFGERPHLNLPDLLSCSVSLDKTLFCAGLKTGHTVVYETADWKKLYTFPSCTPTAPSVVAVSSLRRYAASGYRLGGDIIVFNFAGGINELKVRAFAAPCKEISTLEFSPDTTLLAAASSRQAEGIHIWDIASGSKVFYLPDQCTLQYDHSPYSLIWSHDGQYLVSVDHDYTIYPWKLQKGTEPKLEKDVDKLKEITYPPGGQRFVAEMGSSKILRDASSIVEARTWDIRTTHFFRAQFSPNGQWIVRSDYSSLNIIDIRSGVPVFSIDGQRGRALYVTFLSDREVLFAEYDGIVKIIDLGEEWPKKKAILGQNPGSSRPGHSSGVHRVYYTPNGDHIVSIGHDKAVRLWDPATGSSKETVQIAFDSGITLLLKSGIELVPVGYDTPIRLRSTKSGVQLAVCNKESKLQLFDPITGASIPVLGNRPRNGQCIAVSPCGLWIAAAQKDNTIALWNMESPSEDRVLKGHDDIIFGIEFSPSGQMLVSRSLDLSISFWDFKTGTRIYQITIGEPAYHSFYTNKVGWDCSAFAFSPSGTMIAIGFGRSVRNLDTSFTRVLPELKGHTDLVISVAWSPDSQWLLSSSNDRTVRLWKFDKTVSPVTAQCMYVINDFTSWVTTLAWNPTGALEFVTSSSDSSVSSWRVITDSGYVTRVELMWGSIDNRLVCSAAKILDAIGLGLNQKTLMEQTGALVGMQKNIDYQRNLITPPPKPVSTAPRPYSVPGEMRKYTTRGVAAAAPDSK